MLFQIDLDDCYIYGYGSETVSGSATLDLRLAPVKIISPEECVRQLGVYNAPEPNSGMFCAIGLWPGIDACSVYTFFNSFKIFELIYLLLSSFYIARVTVVQDYWQFIRVF